MERVNMENLREKSWYKNKIIEIIEKIENPKILCYIYYFILEKLKAE